MCLLVAALSHQLSPAQSTTPLEGKPPESQLGAVLGNSHFLKTALAAARHGHGGGSKSFQHEGSA